MGGTGRGAQIGTMISAMDRLFAADTPHAVVVQGDTNSTSAGAQAAHYRGAAVVHVEAGLRSRDRAMPEEINRQLVGVLSDLHCAATPRNAANLVAEGVSPERIEVTGNTVVEAVRESMPTPGAARTVVRRHAGAGPYVLATLHRPENTDDRGRLAQLLDELAALPVPVLLPLHPRTRARIEAFGLSASAGRLRMLPPVDHPEFLALASQARLLVSDSGGVQEEVTVLKKPLVVVRNSTERPESVDAGFATLVRPGPLVGSTARALLADARLPARLAATPSPYGDGTAAAQIVAAAISLADARRWSAVGRVPAPQQVRPPVGRRASDRAAVAAAA